MLKLLYGPTKGRLSHTQKFCRLSKAATFGSGGSKAEMLQVDVNQFTSKSARLDVLATIAVHRIHNSINTPQAAPLMLDFHRLADHAKFREAIRSKHNCGRSKQQLKVVKLAGDRFLRSKILLRRAALKDTNSTLSNKNRVVNGGFGVKRLPWRLPSKPYATRLADLVSFQANGGG